MPSLGELRENYTKSGLDINDAHTDPFVQFQLWMDEAIASGIAEPNAMTLATADKEGIPSARTVLMKYYDTHGFCFFTNYTSRKGIDIAQNPKAALVLPWLELERQIIIKGRVEKTSKEESEKYFHQRPHGSQIGAHASTQSHPIPNKQWLIDRETSLLHQYPEGSEVPLPDFWGGYRVIPNYIEFWQGRPNRLHDRIVYTPIGSDQGAWKRERLSP